MDNFTPNCIRYALVGTGNRARGFVETIVGPHREHAELAGLCDESPTRLTWYNRYLGRKYDHPSVPTCAPNDFEGMLRRESIDTVIVTTTDGNHHTYCIRAMEAGCDVICEKPLTTEVGKTREILAAIERTGRRLRVTFNVRYAPGSQAIKRALLSGAIGRPLAVHYRYLLDTTHGADYFRRWHAERTHSGGLLIHKSSHHFDLVNWLLEDWPDTVTAMGDLQFYGEVNARERGEQYEYDRYTSDHVQARRDPFARTLDDAGEWDRHLYYEAEKDPVSISRNGTGYIRDRNVFGDHIDIEDVMNVLVRYRGGTFLNYSLLTFSPWEGYDLEITGTRGRIELSDRYPPQLTSHADVEHDALPTGPTCTLYPMFKAPRLVDIPHQEGGHGGADPLMYNDLFHPSPQQDPLGRVASHWDGVASILCGFAANQSIASDSAPVKCSDLMILPNREAVVGASMRISNATG